MTEDEIVIDDEFRALIPPLSPEERNQLEQNILADGCRDPLAVWGEILVDGHNRYEICEQHGLPYQTVQVELPDREAALDWIDTNQLGRRNLTPDQASLLRGRIYNRRKKSHGGDRRSDSLSAPERQGRTADAWARWKQEQDGRLGSKGQSGLLNGPTSKELAEQHGVSERTIKRDGRFASAVEELKGHVPDIEREVMGGEYARQDVIEAAKHPDTAAESLKESKHNHRAQGTGENEWYTPDEFLDAARATLGGFDLDPASSDSAQEKVRATAYYTKADDGLAKPWTGSVWLNPPYTQPLIAQFVEKLVSEFDSGAVRDAILLTHNYTDTAWFHMAASSASAICFTRGRIKFYNQRGEVAAPTQGQAFFYFGQDVETFAETFREKGLVVYI